MLTLRKSEDRGIIEHGWLLAKHSFSFADYYDPAHRGFSDLRVINEDEIRPGEGFGTHGHQDMEIITYVLEGELAHRDSMGNVKTLKAGEVQRMSAGSGITHSEFNASHRNRARLIQIWIKPNQLGVTPSYEDLHLSAEEKRNQLKWIVGPRGNGKVPEIHQDAKIFASLLDAGKSVSYSTSRQRRAWIQVVSGQLRVLGTELQAGDGAAVEQEDALHFETASGAEFLLFDLR